MDQKEKRGHGEPVEGTVVWYNSYTARKRTSASKRHRRVRRKGVSGAGNQRRKRGTDLINVEGRVIKKERRGLEDMCVRRGNGHDWR